MSLLKELKSISESIGDNTVDNMVDELSRALSVELDKFVCELLSKQVNEFIRNYHMPLYDDFRSSFMLLLNRYQLMDGDEAGDLHRKIENMLMTIFSQKYSAIGHEVSDVISRKYAQQMITFLKANRIQAPDMAVDKTKVYY